MESNPYESPKAEPATPQSQTLTKTAVIAWEKLRLIFNAVLLGEGLLFGAPLMLMDPSLVAGAILFAICANVFFCLGPMLEMYLIAFRGVCLPTFGRNSLFGVGLGFSILIVAVLGVSTNLTAVPF